MSIARRQPLKRSTKPLKRSPLKRKPTKARPGANPEFLAWLRAWPCWVCLAQFCEERGMNFDQAASDPLERSMIEALEFNFHCGPTQAAHVGIRGLLQHCPDREAMPLGKLHHLHQTAGGGPESSHTLGRLFWPYHALDRDEIFALLHRLYKAETGRDV